MYVVLPYTMHIILCLLLQDNTIQCYADVAIAGFIIANTLAFVYNNIPYYCAVQFNTDESRYIIAIANIHTTMLSNLTIKLKRKNSVILTAIFAFLICGILPYQEIQIFTFIV